MTAVSTTQLELIKAEPIPLEDFTAVQTKHGVRQAIYRYSNTQQARRHWESEPQFRKERKSVKPFIGTPDKPIEEWMSNMGHQPWGHFFTHPPQPDWKSKHLLEFEGEKCALYAASAGYAAISQPGFNRRPEAARQRYADLRFKVAGVIYGIDAKDGHGVADDLRAAAEAVGLPWIGIDMGELFPDLPKGGSIDDVEDVGAAIELILEAARSAQPSAQSTCAEPVQLATPTDPPEPPAQPSAQPALKQVGKGRDQFTLDLLLPRDVAEAATVLTESLNFDPLSIAMPYLAGISSLVKLGTRVHPTPNFSTPPNLYLVVVAPTGSAKTDLYKAVVKGPAEGILERQAQFYEGEKAAWKANKSDTKGPEPGCVISQIEDFTPARLDVQLQAHERAKRGVLLTTDEVAGIFRQAAGDTKNGSGRGETQLLELWDGNGHTTIRMSRDTTSYRRCAVSLLGGIQPDVLRELIDPKDVTGQMARCLFLTLPDTLITPSLKGFTQEELRRQYEARQMLSAFAEHVYDLPVADLQFCRAAQQRFHDWFMGHQVRAKHPATEPILRAMWMKSSGQLSRLAGNLHITNTQGSLDPVSDHHAELGMAVIDQMFAETAAFHLKPTGVLDRLMERFRVIATDPDKCPEGKVSWKRNRNHVGRGLRDQVKKRDFNEALALLAETEGRLVNFDPPIWQR